MASHVALVTGASRGIGAAIARRVAKTGAFVLVASRNLEACEEVAGTIRAAGGRAAGVRLDVADPDSIGQCIADCIGLAAAEGPIDWLVNNAGIAESAPLAPREGTSDDLVRRHMEVNFHGPRRLFEALLSGLLHRGYGRVVHVASSAGLQGYAYVSAYCASKHALVGYARAAADELSGTGVKVGVVCPHYVDSPMTDATVHNIVVKTGRTEAEVRAYLAAQNPGRRLVTQDEVAEAVVQLLEGDEQGRILELDGR